MFNYGPITWTSGLASGGDTKGLGGNAARVCIIIKIITFINKIVLLLLAFLLYQAGYDAVDGINYKMISISGSPLVADIELTTNVDQQGRWVFRLDGTYTPDTGDCPG